MSKERLYPRKMVSELWEKDSTGILVTVQWPSKSAPVSLENSYLSVADRIPADFHNQILCDYLLLALVLWDGDPGVVLTPYTPQVEPVQLRYPSGTSVTVRGSGASPFHVSAPSY